jgi:hypothetical protein
MHMILRLIVITGLLLALRSAGAAEIRHRFLAVDESRAQLLYVDQADPAKDWTLKLTAKHRDLQLVGQDRVLLTFPDGYREYRLADQGLAKEVKGYAGATSARRLADGRTVLACNAQGVTVHELSADDKPLRQARFQLASTRVIRLTPQGTLLIGSGNQVVEGDWNGQAVTTVTLPKGTWAYQALRMPNGHLLAAGGYEPAFFELAADGQVVKTIGGKQTAEAKELGYHFFGGFQVLAGGDIVVSNWTGHGPDDSRKGAQLVQYNSAGRVVWKWHDPQRAGSINGVLVLDGLDTSRLHDDASLVLGPVGSGE